MEWPRYGSPHTLRKSFQESESSTATLTPDFAFHLTVGMIEMMRLLIAALAVCPLLAQETSSPNAVKPESEQVAPKKFTIDTGTKIPLTMLNSVSTKHAVEGDRVYLETLFPVLNNGRIVIPAGSSVAGTVTSFKRPGKVKGRGELYVRFDSLILPNGTTRDFKSRLGSIDGRDNQSLDRQEGIVKGEGNKAGDAQTVGTATAAGASIGAIAMRTGTGAGIGAAAGAAAGLIGVLLTRGPDVVLAKGSTVEMLLDRPLTFEESEIEFQNTGNTPRRGNDGGPVNKKSGGSLPGIMGRRVPMTP